MGHLFFHLPSRIPDGRWDVTIDSRIWTSKVHSFHGRWKTKDKRQRTKDKRFVLLFDFVALLQAFLWNVPPVLLFVIDIESRAEKLASFENNVSILSIERTAAQWHNAWNHKLKERIAHSWLHCISGEEPFNSIAQMASRMELWLPFRNPSLSRNWANL